MPEGTFLFVYFKNLNKIYFVSENPCNSQKFPSGNHTIVTKENPCHKKCVLFRPSEAFYPLLADEKTTNPGPEYP